MKSLEIEYSHEFISNKIKDELILYDIWVYKELELQILKDLKTNFNFNIGVNRNINTLSGGQRSIAYLVTLTYILQERKIDHIQLILSNIIESLTKESGDKILAYLKKRGVDVT